MLTSVRLVDGARQMILLPRQAQGVRLQNLSTPAPTVREVSEPRVDDDGDRDTTRLIGARAVSIELLVTQSLRALQDELTYYLDPGRRPYLVVGDDEWSAERRLRLRADQFDVPITVDMPRGMAKVQAQWKAPDGVWEAAELMTAQVPADIPAQVGITFPIKFPLSWPATQSSGALQVANPGKRAVHFVARLYGPCSGPRLINADTGQAMVFKPGLTLGPGEYIEVSTRARSAYLLGDRSLSRLSSYDYASSAWWQLSDGTTQVRYAPLSASAGAVSVIDFRPSWL
ncbi:phage tail family protein [Actinomadura harenae]|uniref:Phage tail family protein n=1 Tax=Actinomadura harenae TaxID=2483351 RepID=A0A3M2LRF9_9ACTN|nr:hypothetical protein [Actinomadura harenae]RMI39872.1 hypothetical protein EBO15_28305 [Actinomadura harenae]